MGSDTIEPSEGMIIAFAHQKGGVGKSTLAAAVAARLLFLGKKVSILDADPQASLTKWGKRAGIPIEVAHNDLRAVVKKLAAKSEYVIVDVAGRDDDALRSGLMRADIWLAPFGPSQADIDTLSWMRVFLKKLKEINSDILWYTCVNRVPFSFGWEKMVAEIQDDFLGESMCGVVHDRKFWRNFLEGAPNWNNERAANEIDTLMKGLEIK